MGLPEENNMKLLEAKMDRDTAIRIIQKNERGRQGEDAAHKLKRFKLDEEGLRRGANNQQTDLDHAATIIQRLFRGYVTRLKVRQHEQEELVYIYLNSS